MNTISHWEKSRNLLEDPGHTVVTRVFQASSRAYNRVTALTHSTSRDSLCDESD